VIDRDFLDHPHDKMFRTLFSDPVLAAGFLKELLAP